MKRLLLILFLMSSCIFAQGRATHFGTLVLGINNFGTDPNGVTVDLTFQNDEYISNSTDGQLNFGAANLVTTGTFNVGASTLSSVTVTGATALSGTIALGDSTDDVTTLNGTITSNQTYAAGTTPFYFRTSLSGTSGTHNNARFRAQSTASGASTSDIRGLYAQGVTNEGLNGGTVTSIYANSIAKGTSTTTTLRGILIDTETEGTPTALTNMYGMYIRNKSTIAIGGDNYSIVIDNEKMGSGIVQDAGIQLKTTTWGAGVTAWTYGIDMNQTGAFGTADIRLSNGETISNKTDGFIDLGTANLQAATYNFATAAMVTGSADSIVVDFTPDLAALEAGVEITFVAEASNTGAATLTVDGGAEKNIYEASDISALEANDIRNTMVVRLVYDGTQWQQISQSGN